MWRELRQKHLKSRRGSLIEGLFWRVDGIHMSLRFERGKGFFVRLMEYEHRVPGSWHASGSNYPKVDMVRLQETIDTLIVHHIAVS